MNALTLAAKGRFFTVAQIGTLVDQFAFSEGKVGVVQNLKNQIVDPQNSFNLLSHYAFPDDKAQVQNLLK